MRVCMHTLATTRQPKHRFVTDKWKANKFVDETHWNKFDKVSSAHPAKQPNESRRAGFALGAPRTAGG